MTIDEEPLNYYSKTLKSLKAFMKNTDSTFNIVTEQFVEKLQHLLIQRGVVRNTIHSTCAYSVLYITSCNLKKIIEQNFFHSKTSIQEWIEPENVLLRNGDLSASP